MDEEEKELLWPGSLILHQKKDGNFTLLEVKEVKEHINESGEKVRMIYLKDKGEG